MVDALLPGLHVALMSFLCVLAGAGPSTFPPLSLELGGPGGHQCGAMDQVGGPCETPRLMAGALGLPPTCPAQPLLVPK